MPTYALYETFIPTPQTQSYYNANLNIDGSYVGLTAANINNYLPGWSIINSLHLPILVRGDGGAGTYFTPAGKYAIRFRQNDNNIGSVIREMYLTKGVYNLKFKALLRQELNYPQLFVTIYNKNNNYNVLNKQIDASQINVSSLSTWENDASSKKSYNFNVYSDGSYNLDFTIKSYNILPFGLSTTIIMSDIIVENLTLPKPWGVYIAGHPSNSVNNSLLNASGTLFDITGQGRHAVIGGGVDATFASGNGNGALASVPQIQGGSGTKIIWPDNSAPYFNVPFTLSSITRYTNTNSLGLILVSTSGKLIHGHQGAKPGIVVYSNTYKVNNRLTYVNNKTDWVVVCGTNNTNVSIPNNILINNTAYGTSNGGGNYGDPGKTQLTINNLGGGIQASDFAFQQLVIWDVGLDADQLLRISTLQNNYLQTGTIQYPFAIISTPPVITYITNTTVVNKKTNFNVYFTQDVIGSPDASFTYLYSLDGGVNFTDSLQIESPITINNLNEDQSYQFVIKHRNSVGDSEPSNMMTAIAKYPCFLEGSRILRMNVDTYDEEYVAIETLREGDLIKTSCSGYVPIKHIGYKTIPNPTDDPNKRNRLYRFPKSISRQMIADLYITGEHCVLYKDLSDALKEKVYNHMGDIYITEESYRVPACLDERALPYKGEGPVTIWHFALENPDVTHNYGVYANGLLVESCSIKYLSELSKMKLL